MCARISDSPDPRDPDSVIVGTDDGQVELEQLAGELRQATLHVVWRQWRALGAAATLGGSRGHHLRTLVDPEALVLVSLVLMSDERRLADLLHDWAARNSELLSVQRVKNLYANYPDSVRSALASPLAWFATVARDAGKDLRWRSVARTWAEKGQIASHRVGDALAVHEEPSVRVHAVIRMGEVQARDDRKPAKVSARSRATRARLTASAALLLRLRLAFGVGVKADLLAFLLARSDEWATVRDITTATAYTPAAVRRAADDLATARLIQLLEGQPSRYRVTYATWAPLLELEDRPPRWGSWPERFVFVTAFLHWADAARERPLSRYALGAHGRELLEQHRSAFERDLVALWSPHSPIQDWAVFLDQVVRSLIGWMEEMG